MNIKFLGAAGEVTGSSYLVECDGKKVLVDCGIHQGRNEKDNEIPFAVPPSSIDVVLLTHAHMDHSGRLPQLVKNGFKGKIWLTTPTRELVSVLWRDSAHLMREEAEWKTRKNARKGLPPVVPLYGDNDVEAALKKLSPISYDEDIEVLSGVSVRYRDAGHIIGSSMLEVTLNEGGKAVKIAFSGDLGPMKTVMERHPANISAADYVVMESTYGDRLHKTNDETRKEFRDVLKNCLGAGGKVMIPSFAVDRAQRILYEICLMQDEGLLPKGVPIYFDSPMGTKTTEVYKSHTDLLSTEIQNYIAAEKEPFSPDGLQIVSKVEDSQKINDVKNAIVIAGSGMCNGGRIVHHLKHGLYDKNNSVIFVGYQAQGTLGRRLVEGQKIVRVAGEEVKVEAQLHTINGFSAHGDQNDLMSWAGNFKSNPTYIITHGEPEVSQVFAAKLNEAGKKTFVPKRGDELELIPAGVQTVVEQHESNRQSAEDETAKALRIIAIDASSLEEILKSGDERAKQAIEALKPLIVSAQTLLETVRKPL